MNSQQRRKLRRKWTCRNCKHSEYHCITGGCNYTKLHRDSEKAINTLDWCDCTEFESLAWKYKKSLH